MKNTIAIAASIFCVIHCAAQDVNVLLQKVKEKLALVNDYAASGRMKTNVVFLKVPVANVKIYYKKPDKLRIKNEKGISFIPKGAVSINMNNVLMNNTYTALDAGVVKEGNVNLRVVRLLPEDDNNDVVLSTLYIDENYLIRRSKTTTKENGTYELEMMYGNFSRYALPDRIKFTFNIKDYKIPKGVTFDFKEGEKKRDDKMKTKKGVIEIVFTSYQVNKGIPESVFK